MINGFQGNKKKDNRAKLQKPSKQSTNQELAKKIVLVANQKERMKRKNCPVPKVPKYLQSNQGVYTDRSISQTALEFQELL